MNKADLVETVRQKLGLGTSRAEAEQAVRSVVEGIRIGLRRDANVQLIGFGTFKVVERKARAGINPRTGKSMQIAGSKTVRFAPGKELKNAF